MTSTATVTFRNVLVALLAGVCAMATIAAGEAHAAVTHPYTGVSFGPGGVGSGAFSYVGGVAADPRSGDVFVLDNQRLYKFDASGEPVDFSSTGTNVIALPGSTGGGADEVAVDGSIGPAAGDIYVAIEDELRVYSESGTYLGHVGEEVCGVAVDQTGNVYVGQRQVIKRYAPAPIPSRRR